MDRFTRTIYFKSNHPVFRGHFPSNPVVPAALLLANIQTQFETSHDQTVSEILKVRFMEAISPESNLTIEFQRTTANNWRFFASTTSTVAISGVFETHNDSIK